MFHNTCTRNDTRSWTHHASQEGSEANINQPVHTEAFKCICNYAEEHILLGHNVEWVTIIKEIYLSYIIKHNPP